MSSMCDMYMHRCKEQETWMTTRNNGLNCVSGSGSGSSSSAGGTDHAGVAEGGVYVWWV